MDRSLDALRKTTKLMDFLAEVTAAVERDPITDILDEDADPPDPIVWLDRLPEGVRLVPYPDDDVILRLRPPRSLPEPLPPSGLFGWIDSEAPRGVEGPAPCLLDVGPTSDAVEVRGEPPARVERAFGAWAQRWQSWRDNERRLRSVRVVYEALERAAKTMEQQDDEYEFVLGVGLLRWATPDGMLVRRHLVTETAVTRLDRKTAEVSVSLGGGRRRVEDREIFNEYERFRADRGRPTRQEIADGDGPILAPELLPRIVDLLGDCLDTPVQTGDRGLTVSGPLPTTPTLALSPALFVRRRSRALLAEAYQQIGEALRQPDAQVPVALAQLVVDTEPKQRSTWLREQGAIHGDVLGSDPLFPLPTNDEQMRVIGLLRSETGIVVQGPPGTGKTHTIANLVSALLARGQRVLVTSQKDQALSELRDKVPPSLRDLCVQMTGGSNVAAELGRGLDALSDAMASSETTDLADRIEMLRAERGDLRSRSVRLNERIQRLREAEFVAHDPVVPGFSTDRYRGSLGQIAREVTAGASRFGWMPPVAPDMSDYPPLLPVEALELLQLMRTTSPARRARLQQRIPEPADLPTPAAVTKTFVAEREARAGLQPNVSPLTIRLAAAGEGLLADLERLGRRFATIIERLGLDSGENTAATPEWVARAAADQFAGRHSGLWRRLAEVHGQADRLQDKLRTHALGFEVEIKSGGDLSIGSARRMLTVGRELHQYLVHGDTYRTLLASRRARRRATILMQNVEVDGEAPVTLPLLEAALDHLEAHVAAAQLVRLWADVRVTVPTGRVGATLSELQDCDRLFVQIRSLATVHSEIRERLESAGLSPRMPNIDDVAALIASATAARQHVRLRHAQAAVEALQETVRRRIAPGDSCPELGLLADAIQNRSLDAYQHGIDAIDAARGERYAEGRRVMLAENLGAVHPGLLALLQETVDDTRWEDRLRQLPAAWAWSKADQYVRGQRTADTEREIAKEYDAVEAHLAQVTEQLAAAEAIRSCAARMTDKHASALRSYRAFRIQVGAGAGSKARELRKAARAAMDKAKGAVPAWVLPLPNLLESLPVERNAFDVIIVDEASQVGLEHLFLLWLAPRIIVVGDDQQCTPAPNRMGRSFDVHFQSLREHLGDLDIEIRYQFTPKSHLYGLLSARSGKDAVVRLREHFRCMPEIINWSAAQFYRGTNEIIALRERTAADLEPLRVVHVTGAYPEGKGQKLRNPVEAKRIVAQLLDCLADPRYEGKNFGIIVLHGHDQIRLLDQEINANIPPETRAARQISVGSAPNFQGAERDVVFLSAVVTEPPRRLGQHLYQNYNVAASRARDQLWMFTSVRPTDYKPGDLRASLASYMLNPPSVYGPSPDLKTVSADQHCVPFQSLFEQRVYRVLKRRGYHVVPQLKVGSRSLDLVVVGDGGRLAVECDGHRWHTSPSDVVADARRDRELRRMGWEVLRIRESEFEINPEREMNPVFSRLAERDIHPRSVQASTANTWVPVDLPLDDEEGGPQ
ncbi:AAA domain-containing protein [Phytohabitans kaempferiae]|uniref:AAA domain-containing protein n=1 Tax=Phytohabitans kaempferiae TaxID=1620943 RepID=A0ABV6M7Y5_9ACTN